MAAGDRIKVITGAEFDPLEQQINDSTSGLAGRVDQLESNPEFTLIEAYDSTFNYPAGYPILVGGRLTVSNKATTGAFTSADWDTITRAKGDPVEIDDGVTTASFALVSGSLDIVIDDGTNVNRFKYSVGTGRLVMTDASALADAGDKDGVIKEDLALYAEKEYDDLTLPAGARVAIVDEVGKLNYYDNVEVGDLFKLTQVDHDNTAKRFTQTDEVVDTAADNKDILTKKDGDALYRGKSEYPIGEVFCLGVVKVDSTGAETTNAYGFKYSTTTVSGVDEKTSATDMDYIIFNIAGYKPTGSTLSAIWIDISGEERDNIYSYNHTLDTAGTDATVRVYSVDNSDWSGDNVMGHDSAVMWVKIWAVASA